MYRRRYKHWSLRYAIDRLGLFAYQTLHPDAPWLVPDAVRFLDCFLRPEHFGFEWGAGRSTRWFSRRVAHITSIEHDERWYKHVQQQCYALPQNNVDLRLAPVTDSNDAEYVEAINKFHDGKFDFVLVDGLSALRDRCALAAIPKICVGGMLVIDDIHRYLPSNSRAPLALPPGAEPLTEDWDFALHQLALWDKRVFTSGVTDTALWVRT